MTEVALTGRGIAGGATTEQRSCAAFAPAGQSTQMIVGATETPDATILSTVFGTIRPSSLRRVYYCAYSPILHSDVRLPIRPPPLVREHRLYQADWLMRFYQFRATEITEPSHPNLDLEIDPKLAWALRHRECFPVDLNTSDRFMLLRVPGIGVRNVNRIVQIRRHHRIRLDDLSRLRVAVKKVRPWVITADHNPDVMLLDRDDLRQRIVRPMKQLELFDLPASARSGEL